MLRNKFVLCLSAYMVLLLASCKKDQALENPTTINQKTILIGEQDSRKSRCNTDHRMQTIYQKSPAYRNSIKEGRAIAHQKMKQLNARSSAEEPLLTIPIHFIIVHGFGEGIGTGNNISKDRVLSQLEVLNLDFLRKNTDADQTPNIFAAAGSQIQFCLANIDPVGNPTDGISRYATNQNFDENELTIKSATTWNPIEYLNVWIAPDIDALGYAYLPSTTSLPDRDEDGAVILTSAFGGPGSGAEGPFDLGRTLTHEVGHYLGLDHIWGEGCNIDDGISDTPDQEEENSGCRTHPSPSCNNQGDMFMNYMDYSDDHCLNAFTAGQANYMRQILQTSRAALVTPGRSNCISGPIDPADPSCDDGVKNGSETGIDCGGPNCTPCENSIVADAGLTDLQVIVSDEPCGGNTEITAVLNNYGSTLLTQVTLDLSSDGGLSKKIEWSESLVGGQSVAISFGIVQLPLGEHNLLASTSNPNSQADPNRSNDAVSTTFQSTGGSSLRLIIQPDDYGSEISWRIKNERGSVMVRGQGYEDFSNDLIKESFCLPDGCYRLIFRDAYGDGICCDYGEGYYTLQGGNGERLIESDGYYGSRETTWFCIENRSFNRQKIEREARSNLPMKIKEVSKRPVLGSN